VYNVAKNMKKNLILFLSLIALISAVFLSIISSGAFFLFSLIVIVFGVLITSLTIAVWSNQSRKKSFLNSLPISIGLNSVIFILGYLYSSLQPIILK
jgi:predicted RND superfamily exporter protein